MRTCPVCSTSFPNFLPLPTHYFEVANQLGARYSLDDYETLNIGQYSCPACGASDRDRLYALYIKYFLIKSTTGQLKVLEIAPAQGLSKFIRAIPLVQYRSADLCSPLADDKVDIMDMHIYRDMSFDFIICSHVLEHVRDDGAAMREIFRVLAHRGKAIIMVPIVKNLDRIDEDADELDPKKRIIRFGQDDHIRQYSSREFTTRLEHQGFSVQKLDLYSFEDILTHGKSVFKMHGINDGSVLYIACKGQQKLTSKSDISQEESKPNFKEIYEPHKMMSSRTLQKMGEIDAIDFKVTVAIPAYKANYLDAALRSALSQNFENFEILICDDCRDNSVAKNVLPYLEIQDGPPIRYFYNETQLGEAKNCNKCVDLARGKYIKFLYDDDVLLPGVLAAQAAILDSHPEISLVTSRRQLIDEKGQLLADTIATLSPFDTDVCVNGYDLVSFLAEYTVNFIGEPVCVMARRVQLISCGPDLMSLAGIPIEWVGDLTIYTKLLRLGNLAMLSELGACFRISDAQFSKQSRVNPSIGNESHMNFKRLLVDLGWRRPTDNQMVGVSRLAASMQFDQVDLLARLSHMWTIIKSAHCFEANLPASDLKSTENLKNKAIKSERFACIIHLYYTEMFNEISEYLDNLPKDSELFFSLCSDESNKATQIILEKYPKANVYVFENRGRDIYPFLKILTEIINLGYKAICKIHTKKSIHNGNAGNNWRTNLFEALLGNCINVARCLKKLDQGAGIVGATDYMFSCKEVIGRNENRFFELLQRLNIAADFCADLKFPAGSMFWFTPEALRPVIDLNLKIQDFEEEQGQLDGTLAHALERAFAVGCAKVGYQIMDSSDAHSIWLENFELQLVKGLKAYQKTAAIHVIISGSENMNAANFTIDSLRKQLSMPASFSLLQNNEKLIDIIDISISSWILLLHAGDYLCKSALAVLDKESAQINDGSVKILYFDSDELDSENVPRNPNLKPDFNYDLLLSYPYISRSILVRTDWLKDNLGKSFTCDLELAYRLALAAYRESGSAGFLHVPAVLSHLTSESPQVFAPDSETWQVLASTLQEHVAAVHPGGHVLEGSAPGTFNVIHPLPATPLVSIIIPTKDQLPFLTRCLESVLEKTSYPNFEILIVDNDSQSVEAKDYLLGLAALDSDKIRIYSLPGVFNFSKMNNLAVQQSRGEFVLLLNNDTAALQPDWLGHLMRHALRKDVGVVGARLVFPDGKLQHAGIILGLRGPAEHPFIGTSAAEPGYMYRAQVTQNFSAVTAACLLVSKALYQEVGGLDEDTFGVSYNDVDFCLRVGATGKRIVWTPLATLLHEGSASQRADVENSKGDHKVKRFSKEQSSMYQRWPKQIATDPAYNPNLSLVESGFEIETNPLLRFSELHAITPHRVVAFAADETGCGHYRIFQPMQAMSDAGLCTGGASPEMLGPNLVLRSGADRLIFQRPYLDSDLDLLNSLLPLKGIKKIYELDDNITRVPIKSAHHGQFSKDIRGRISKAIGLCDRLVVSTEPLAHELRGKNDDIRVIQNRLATKMWGDNPPIRQRLDRPKGIKPRVAWAGGIGHSGDLEMIGDVIKELSNQIDWIFFGMCPDSLKPFVSEFHVGVTTLEYPYRMMELSKTWDLAIAPLEINSFNECKSNLKLLEYGWCGVPVVCSDITPYQGDLPCKRVKNRFADWRSAILSMTSDLEACSHQGLQLQQAVEASWMLKGENLQAWYEAWTD